MPLEGPANPYDGTSFLDEFIDFDTESCVYAPIPFDHVLDASYTSTVSLSP